MPNDTIADIEIRGREDLELTVLMPCLDEQDSIGACVAEARETLDRAGIAGEVLVVDNGSTDGSPNSRAAPAPASSTSRCGGTDTRTFAASARQKAGTLLSGLGRYLRLHPGA